MRCRKTQTLIDLYLVEDPLLDPQERGCFEDHLRDCPQCRAACDRGRQVVALVRSYGQVSEDTLALLAEAHTPRALLWPSWARDVLRVGAVAACLAIAVLGWWVVLSSEAPATTSRGSASFSAEETGMTIESMGRGGRIIPGTIIQTSAREVRSLALNGRHQVVMNADTRLSIEPLVVAGQVGCQVNLAQGEVYVHVEHDGNPFVVRTDHGRAVITGTTFDVKVAETGTTLIVAEGSVRFESEGGAVQVAAGRQSMIGRASAPPSRPTACDATALTIWAGAAWSVNPVAQVMGPGDVLADSLPVFAPSPGVRTDFQDICYAEWVEQNRDWFRRRFPEVFRLAEALAQEGVNVGYADLLLDSGLVWQFAWPPAGPERLLAADDAAIIKAAARHSRDLQWLKDRRLLSGPANPVVEQAFGMEAFSRWQKESAAILGTDEVVPTKLLFDSLQACDHLRYARMLIWLTIETGRYPPSDASGHQLQELLRLEILSTDRWTSDCLRLLTMEKSDVRCDSDPCRQLIQRLHGEITQIIAMEGRLADEMAHSRP